MTPEEIDLMYDHWLADSAIPNWFNRNDFAAGRDVWRAACEAMLKRPNEAEGCLSDSTNCRRNNPQAVNCCSLYEKYAGQVAA